MTFASIESDFNALIDELDHLREVSSAAGEAAHNEVTKLTQKIEIAKSDLEELKNQVKEKNFNESLHISSIMASDLDQLVHQHISVPASLLKLYWDHLKLRVDPLGPSGGVAVHLGFPPESRLPDLRFCLKSSPPKNNFFIVYDCNPMVIGLSELVEQLNNDSKSGALARFCCRIRARYTAQYMNEF